MKGIVVVTCIIFTIFLSCNEDTSLTGPVSSGRYEYTAYDSSGDLVVTGWIFLDTDNPSKIEGLWNLKAFGSADNIGPQTGSGELQGKLEHDKISINLNPEFIDNNVCLVGSVEGKSFIGLWQWISYSGVTNEGAFTASKTT